MTTQLDIFLLQKDELLPVGCLSPGAVLRGLVENQTYLIQVDDLNSRLYVDDAPLTMDSRRQYWRWSPGFYAGEVVMELERHGQHEPIQYRVDIEPSPKKTGREQYIEYIRQIVD